MLFISSLLFILVSSFANIPELETKQAADNLKYISKDGKVTYYQTKSGDLSYSSNYTSYKIIENIPNTYYNLYFSPHKKKILFTVDTKYYSEMQSLKNLDIYISNFGGTSTQKIAIGKAPTLHLNDDYFSYFDYKTKEIYFRSTITTKSFKVSISNNVSPYFTPEVLMINDKDIIFTDLNEKGQMGVIFYSYVDKKKSIFFKSNFENSYLEMCKNEDKVYILEKSLNDAKPFTNIYSIDLFSNENFKNVNTIYASTFTDIGNLICTKDYLYFIKTKKYIEDLNTKDTDIAEFNLKEQSLNIIKSDINPTQILIMDDFLLAAMNGKLYLAKGDNKSLLSNEIKKTKL